MRNSWWSGYPIKMGSYTMHHFCHCQHHHRRYRRHYRRSHCRHQHHSPHGCHHRHRRRSCCHCAKVARAQIMLGKQSLLSRQLKRNHWNFMSLFEIKAALHWYPTQLQQIVSQSVSQTGRRTWVILHRTSLPSNTGLASAMEILATLSSFPIQICQGCCSLVIAGRWAAVCKRHICHTRDLFF